MPIAPLLAAPIIGSFLATLAIRLPEHRSLLWPPSSCDTCQRRLRPRDLIPLASYAFLRGRCRDCRARIPKIHPAMELAALAIALWATLATPETPWISCALGWTLLTLAAIDLRTGLLPDALTLPLLLAGLTLRLNEGEFAPLFALGAALGYGLIRATNLAYRLLRHRDGLGQGDAKLLAAGGAWLGPDAIAPILLLAAILGLAHALLLRAGGTRLSGSTAIPFGPALALAIWLIWLYGTPGGFPWSD